MIVLCSGYLCYMNKKEQIITHLIREKIKKKDPLAEVILFGSHARGQSNQDSDWDILILLDQSNVNRAIEKEYRDQLYDVELEVGEPISTLVYSKADWELNHTVTSLFQNIKKEGIHLESV